METYGTTDKVITKITLDKSLEGAQAISGTLTYSQSGTYEKICSELPQLGTTSTFFPSSCVLQKIAAVPAAGLKWTVTLTYYAPAQATSQTEPKAIKVNATTQTQSILLHPRYAAIDANVPGVHSLLRKLCEGGAETDKIPPSKEGETDYKPDDTAERKAYVTIDKVLDGYNHNALIVELRRKIKKGAKDYKSPHVQLMITEKTEAIPSLAKLGKIDTPPANANVAPPGCDWLLSTANVDGNKQTGYKVEKTYESSDVGAKWDKDLYN